MLPVALPICCVVVDDDVGPLTYLRLLDKGTSSVFAIVCCFVSIVVVSPVRQYISFVWTVSLVSSLFSFCFAFITLVVLESVIDFNCFVLLKHAASFFAFKIFAAFSFVNFVFVVQLLVVFILY